MNSEALALEQAAMREREAEAAAPQPKPVKTPLLDKIVVEVSEEIASKRSKDVAPYVRHSEDCKHSHRDDNEKCECPYWLYDKLNRKRFSARTIHLNAAQKEAQRIMDSRDPLKKKIADLERKREYATKTIAYAKKKYIEDCEQRDLGPETIEAYECAITQLETHLHGNGITALGDITPELMKDFRGVWPDKEKASKNKKQRQIKTFFKWVCEQAKWLDVTLNPALALTTIKGDESVPAIPFYDDQFDAIIDATYIYENSNRFRDAAIRLRALILLMRWSGLAIRDALTLPRTRICDEGILQAQRTKTKTWVTMPLPHEVIEALRALKNSNPDYFFWNGIARPRSLVGDYNRMFRRLWKLVRWPRPVVDGENNPIAPHSHMFRHSYAYWWLNTVNPATGKLGDIRDLQLLLGHKRLATTEKHYSGFMPDQNKRLNAEVRARHASKTIPEVTQPAPEPEHHVRIRVRQRAHRSR